MSKKADLIKTGKRLKDISESLNKEHIYLKKITFRIF